MQNVADRFWICPTCRKELPFAPLGLDGIDIGSLPSFLAIAADQWAREQHPVQRLWRIVDTVELLVRYSLALVLADLRRGSASGLPAHVVAQVRPHVKEPALGSWTSLVDALRNATRLRGVAAEAAAAFQGVKLVVGRVRGRPEESLLALRNLVLAHGLGIPAALAQTYLDAHERRALELLRSPWLAAHTVIHVATGGGCRRLSGASGPEDLKEPLALREELVRYEDHVVVVEPEGILDLNPFFRYGVPELQARSRPVRGQSPASAVYLRCEDSSLLYGFLDGDPRFGEVGSRSSAVCASFSNSTHGRKGGIGTTSKRRFAPTRRPSWGATAW